MYRYLDAASSEPLHPAAREAMLAALDQGYADPRRLHGPGRNARLILDNARAAVAEALRVRPDEVVFTGSGTAAIQQGLLGLAHAGRADAAAYAAVEHSAVVQTLQHWGRPVRELPVDALGRVDASAMVGPGDLVVVQSANHEVGTTQPVTAFADRGHALFVDACASMGRLPLPEGWAAAAGSAHKWGGPAGVGVLLVRKGSRWQSPLPFDDRADHREVGFENVPAALGAAAALQAVVADRDAIARRQHQMIDQVRRTAAAIDDVEVVGDPDDRLPHLVTFSCLYANGEQLVTELDRRGFGVASGSACTTSTLEPSHVLAAMGALTHGNVRVSLTFASTQEDVDAFCAALPDAVAAVRP